MKKFFFAAIILLYNSIFIEAQNSKFGIEISCIEKINYSIISTKENYNFNPYFDNFYNAQPDIALNMNYIFSNKSKFVLGIAYSSQVFRCYKSGLANISYDGWIYGYVKYSGTRKLQENSILFPVSFVKSLELCNSKKNKWFLTPEIGIGYQYKYQIKNSIEDLQCDRLYPLSGVDLELVFIQNNVFEQGYDKKVVNRNEFNEIDKKNMNNLFVFVSNGISYEIKDRLNIGVCLKNSINIFKTKTNSENHINTRNGNISFHVKAGVNF